MTELTISPWYVPSLLPILALSTALAGSQLARDRRALAFFSLSLSAWATAVLLIAVPETRWIGERLLMVGFFLPATFVHAASTELDRPLPWLPVIYGLGIVMTLTSLGTPGLYLAQGGTAPGQLFWPMFGLTALAGIGAPLWMLREVEGQSERRKYLALGGVLVIAGCAGHVLLMLTGWFYPLGLYVVLVALALLTWVDQSADLPPFGRFVERSQRYTLMVAALSAGWAWLLGSVMHAGGGWTLEAAPLLFVLALAGQPWVTEARGRLTEWFFPGQDDAEGLTVALARSEARAEHAERLAEIGTLASAVAHEVRNPLGVITACASVLERQGADVEVVDEIRDQVTRASEFADALLAYARPDALSLRSARLADVVASASSEVGRSVGAHALEVTGDAEVPADVVQAVRLFAILLENAVLAGAETIRVTLEDRGHVVDITVDDDGPGVPEALEDRLLEPFVTGRARSGPRPGTGLGLAIARGVAERHRGALCYVGRGALGGASFRVTWPRVGLTEA